MFGFLRGGGGFVQISVFVCAADGDIHNGPAESSQRLSLLKGPVEKSSGSMGNNFRGHLDFCNIV